MATFAVRGRDVREAVFSVHRVLHGFVPTVRGLLEERIAVLAMAVMMGLAILLLDSSHFGGEQTARLQYPRS